ncbi:SDR family oxidoreductase [Parvularcula sp. LCG005]|uniref:SDR family oxidoreductase n=1 Tax=Parvularcula sp. LCG005 TaxID=3078805 RepID=UPI002942CF71|nr:SDR family oxidoreductase [Parvularcula sp. LCG005]WOI54684.1 SDR family oxidoreductase [Parvularcula sp. LCG005]
MHKILNGQTAVVTGGSSGIGAACAVGLAREGANVVLTYHSHEEDGEKVADECRSEGVQALSVHTDVTKKDDIEDLIKTACAEFGHLDIMIANAGVQVDASLLDMSLEDWETAIKVDLTGQFLCAQAAARQFIAQGFDKSVSKAAGKIIHISSVHDEIPWAGHANYAAAKGGLKEFMRTAAQEWAVHRIRVNAVSPGAIKTDINRDVWSDEEKKRDLLKLIPYGRLGEPEDVASVVAWLASDQADYITGNTIYVDGGMMLYPGFRDNG